MYSLVVILPRLYSGRDSATLQGPSPSKKYKRQYCALYVNCTSTVESIVFLCTRASLYAPYSLLLISNKFWIGGGGWEGGESVGGDARGPSWRGRIRGVGGGGRIREVEQGC